MFTAAALGSGVLSVAIERIAFKPLRDASRIAPLITALGVSVFLQNAVLLLLGPDIRNYDASASSRSRAASISARSTCR